MNDLYIVTVNDLNKVIKERPLFLPIQEDTLRAWTSIHLGIRREQKPLALWD